RACRDDVLVPRGLLAEGEGHHERIRERAHAEGGRIDAARAPAAVAEDADYGHPPSARDEHHRRVDDPGHEPDHSPGAFPKAKAVGADGRTVPLDAGHVAHDRLEARSYLRYSLVGMIPIRDYRSC